MTYTEFLDNSPMTKFLWLLLSGIALAQILDGLDFQSTSFALPLIIREFQLSSTQAGAIGFFYFANNIQNVGFSTWLPTIFVQQGFTLIRSFKFTTIILAVTPIGQVFAIWLQDRMPRKWAMLLLAALSSAFFFLFGLSFELKMPIAITAGANVGYQFFSQGIIVVLYTLGTELFPTSVRSLGMGLVTATGRIGSILGPFVLGLFLTFGTAIHQIIYYFAMPLLLAALLAILLIRIDPRQKNLEQIHEEEVRA